jgi:hypothetical protein
VSHVKALHRILDHTDRASRLFEGSVNQLVIYDDRCQSQPSITCCFSGT